MRNVKDLEVFLAEKIKDKLDVVAESYVNFYSRIDSYFPTNKEPINYVKEDFISILSSLNAKTTTNYTAAKSRIRNYFEWLMVRGEMTEEQLSEFSAIQYDDLDFSNTYLLYYFKNFGELYFALEDAIACRVKECSDDKEYDALRCAVYLTWYGFTTSEMSALLKKDIDENNLIIYKGEKKIPVHISNKKAMSCIVDYRDSVSYCAYKFGRQVELKYKESEFLFRSYKNSSILETAYNSMVQNACNFSDEIGKRFNIGKIYQSGMYYRAYISEQENGLIDKSNPERVVQLFEIDAKSKSPINLNAAMNVSLRAYKKYKQVFHYE